MTKKLTTIALSSILLAGCAQFAEMQETRDSGSAYLTGKFDQQICELEQVVKAYPWLDYPTSRIVQEVIPHKTGKGISWILETKHTAPQAKIRHYGKKVEYPSTKEELNDWMKTIDDNIAQMKDKLKVAAEEAKRKEEAAAEEAKRQEEERIAKKTAPIVEELVKHGFKRELASTCVSFDIKPENVVSLCQRYGIHPGLVGTNDITQGRYENYPEWTESGRKLVQMQLVDLLKKKVVEQELLNKIEQACADLMATINTNHLLSIDAAAVNVVINSKFKSDVEEKFRVADIKDLLREHEYMLDEVTNAYIALSSPWSGAGTKIGPLFLLSKDETAIVFNKNVIEAGVNRQCEEVAEVWSNQYGFNSYVNELLHIYNKVPQRDLVASVEKWLKISTSIKDAKELALAEQARIKQLITAYETMPEAEKFPLLSVQPKPQMLMKGVSSGVSLKWVQGWLLANKIEHDEPQIDKSSGRATIVGRFYNMDGRRVRTVKFSFCDDALVELAINLEGQSISPDAMIEKYVREFGVEAKVQRIDGEVAPLNQVDNIVVWARDNTVKITTEDVGAVATCKAFAGLVMISENTAQRLVFAGTEERLRYLVFDKDSKADLVINADGTTLRCTKDGEVLKSFAKDKLSDFSKGIDGNINKIEVWDRKLYDYMTDKAKKQKEEKEKAEEEAKKAKAAAALDF